MQYVDPSSSGLWYQMALLVLSGVALFWSRLTGSLRKLWRRVFYRLR